MPLAPYVGGITNALTAANWTRVNYGNIFAIPDKPCLRSRVGIRRGIGRKHPTHERLMLFGLACFDGVWPIHYGNMAHEGQKRKGAMLKSLPNGEQPNWFSQGIRLTAPAFFYEN
jgi:hypothetical protein